MIWVSKLKMLDLRQRCISRYGTFDRITNRSMEDLSYTYLHYDLLGWAALTTITLRVKSPYIKMHEQHLQKGMFVIEFWH